MNASTTVLAGADGSAITIAARRVDLALDALHEVQALSLLFRDVLERESDEATVDALGRGMMARIRTLADAASGALDPNGEPTDALSAMVTCRASA